MKRSNIYLKIIIFFGIGAVYQTSFTGSGVMGTEDWVQDKIGQKKAFYEHRLSLEEQQIIELFDSTRIAEGIEPLEVNLNLCKAMKDRIDKTINDATITDTALVAQKLSEFLTYLGKKSFLVKGDSVSAIRHSMGLHYELCKEVSAGSNVEFGLCCVKDTLRSGLYSLIYLTKYYVEFLPSEVRTFFPPDSDIQTHRQELNGKTNAKYIKYMLYPGGVLPFYYEGKEMTAAEMRTRENGSFSFQLSYYFQGATQWRVAIFARDKKDEPYSILDFWAL